MKHVEYTCDDCRQPITQNLWELKKPHNRQWDGEGLAEHPGPFHFHEFKCLAMFLAEHPKGLIHPSIPTFGGS